MRGGPNALYLHGGETVGYNSEASHDPANKLTLVVWTNLTISPSNRLTANQLMLNVLDRIYKLSPLAPQRSAASTSSISGGRTSGSSNRSAQSQHRGLAPRS